SCCESPDFALFCKNELESGSNKDKGSNMPDISECSETGFKDTKLAEGEYNRFYANIEDLPAAHYGRYDLVFSIAAFERIHKFPQALDKMYMALKPGGLLFAMFSPIWSAHNGHHLPDITDKYGKIFNFHESPIPPWGHLVMRPADLCQYLYRFTDKETADLMVYHVYNSPFINRFFTEDYMRFFWQSRFKIIKMSKMFFSETQDKTQAILEGLYPGRRHFTNNAMQVILERPIKDPGDMAEAIYLNQQGEDLFGREKTEDAFEMFNKAVHVHPGYAPAHNNLAVILWHADNISQAIIHFRKALEIDPDNRDAVINSARCLESIGEIEGARDICRSFLKNNQGDAEVLQGLSGLDR
ncbi:MAG: tetratricopeptide repeat protein, partial [Thermodesulfobacteriota bacterium]|nr:tetratricopeptide repeat protein [Thermodesulfobacteriota bacterium]